MDRIIEVKVNGSYITKDNRNAGVQHEANTTSLRIEFDQGWDSYAKKVTWWDAKGENPVEITLGTNLLEDATASTRIYLCPIPGEPLAECGECTFVIDGYVDGKRQRSAADCLWVKEAPFKENAGQPSDPTPSQAEQLQKEIDGIKGTISQAVASAAAAAKSEANAKASETAASGSASAAANSETAAAGSAASAAAAASAAETAQGKAEAAQTAAEAAAESAGSALENAQAAAQSASNSALSAYQSEQRAHEAAENASTAEDQALRYATGAARAAEESQARAADAAASASAAAESAAAVDGINKTAQSWAVGGTGTRDGEDTNNAKYWSDRAAAVVGGDFATKAEAQGYVDTHNQSSAAHADLRQAIAGKENAGAAAAVQQNLTAHMGDTVKHVTAAERNKWNGKADLVDGKVPSSQLPDISSVKIYTATIGTTWTENDDGTKTQTVTVTGVKATDTAIVDHSQDNITDYAAFVAAENEYLTCITNGFAVTVANGITFTIFGDANTVAIPIVVEVV